MTQGDENVTATAYHDAVLHGEARRARRDQVGEARLLQHELGARLVRAAILRVEPGLKQRELALVCGVFRTQRPQIRRREDRKRESGGGRRVGYPRYDRTPALGEHGYLCWGRRCSGRAHRVHHAAAQTRRLFATEIRGRHLGGKRERIDGGTHLVVLAPAQLAFGDVDFEFARFGGRQRADREDRDRIETCVVVNGRHTTLPSKEMRSCFKPARIRVLTVPSGNSLRRAISSCVIPPKKPSSIGLRWSYGSAASALRTRSPSRRAKTVSSSEPSGGMSAGISVSRRVAWLRSTSSARLRVMRAIHPPKFPPPNASGELHTLRKTACARSSGADGSPTTLKEN